MNENYLNQMLLIDFLLLERELLVHQHVVWHFVRSIEMVPSTCKKHLTIVSSCCTSLSFTSRALSTRICPSKPVPQPTYNTLPNPKMLDYSTWRRPPQAFR
jgi:hypothetical protein